VGDRFLNSHITEIYFIYGLGFFIMGLTVALESGHASALPLARATPWLAAFGLLHGAAEWSDMLTMVAGQTAGQMPAGRRNAGHRPRAHLFHLPAALRLRAAQSTVAPTALSPAVIPTVLTIYVAGLLAIATRISPTSAAWIEVADAWTSYAAGIPAFVSQCGPGCPEQVVSCRRRAGPEPPDDRRGHCFLLVRHFRFGLRPQAALFPGLPAQCDRLRRPGRYPIQLVRAINAVVIAFFFISALRIFAAEDRRKLQEALESQRRLQANAEVSTASCALPPKKCRPSMSSFASRTRCTAICSSVWYAPRRKSDGAWPAICTTASARRWAALPRDSVRSKLASPPRMPRAPTAREHAEVYLAVDR